LEDVEHGRFHQIHRAYKYFIGSLNIRYGMVFLENLKLKSIFSRTFQYEYQLNVVI